MFSIYADGQSIYDPSVSSFYLFNPQVKLEFGKSGSLEFSIPPTNLYYDSLKQLKTQITVDLDGEEIFRGRVFSIELDFNNFKKVYCEGNLSYLVDSVQKGEAYTGTTRALFNKIIASHNSRVEAYKQFTVGNVTIEDRSIILSGQSDENLNVGDIDYKQIAINSIADEWNNTFDCIQNWLIDYCGGYLRTRRQNGVDYIDYLENYDASSTQEIQFGDNLLDFSAEASAEDLFTVLVPIGDENLTIASVNGGSDEISDSSAVERYGRIVRTHVFSNVNDANTLLTNAQRYLAENVELYTTYTVKAIDLHLLDDSIRAIHIGDRVHLNSAPHGVAEYLTCTEIEYDLANPDNNTYTFGNPKQSLTQRYREDQRKSNDTNSSAASAGSVGAASAGAASRAAADAAEKATDELEKKIYEEWIDIDPDNPDGVGSLGGLYRIYSEDKKVLEREVGIKFDAGAGNINMHSLTKQLNLQGQKIAEAEARSESFSGYVNGQLTAIQSMVARVETTQGINEAKWEVFADEMGSAISGKADRFDVEALSGELGGTAETIDDMKNTLTRKVGIKWNTEQGSLDIFTLSKKVDEQGNDLSYYAANLRSLSDETHSEMSMIASKVDDDGVKIASLGVRADALGTRIEGIADELKLKATKGEIGGAISSIDEMKNVLTRQVGINFNAATGNINLNTLNKKVDDEGKLISKNATYINQLSNDLTNQITMEASHYSENKSNIASIQITANKLGNEIQLKADKTVVQSELLDVRGKITALEGDIGVLKARELTAEELSAKLATINRLGVNNLTAASISAPNIYVADEGGRYPAASTNFVTLSINSIANGNELGRHYHEVLVNDTTGVVTLGKPTSTPQSFNIRATRTYIEGVAAAEAAANITNITIDSSEQDTSVSYNETTKIISFYRSAEAYRNNTPVFNKDPIRVTVSGAKAYAHGLRVGAENQQQEIDDAVAAVTVDNLKVLSQTYNSSTHNTAIVLAADLTNGTSYTRPNSVIITGAEAYSDGRQSVRITSVAKDTVGGTSEMFNGDHTTTVYIKATASNNETFSGSIKTGTIAYDKGYSTGYSKGTSEGSSGVTIKSIARQTGKADTYNTSTHTTTMHLIATASNSKTLLADLTTNSVAYDTGYTEGETAGKKQVKISSLDKRTDVTAEVYSESKHTTTIYAIAKASNGETKTASFTTGTDAYTDGYSKGQTASAPTKIERTNTISDDGQYYKISATAKNAAGTALITQTWNTGTAPYNNGVKSVTVSSISHTISSRDQSSHIIKVSTTAKASNGATKTTNLDIGTAAEYNAGVDSVSVSSISHSVSSRDQNSHIIHTTLTATASNSKTLTVGWDIDSTAEFNAGKNSVTISALDISKAVYEDPATSGVAGGRYVATVDATASNGKTKQITKNISAIKAYSKGQSDYTISKIDLQSATYSDPGESGVAGGRYVVVARATLNNGNIITSSPINVSAIKAYDQGKRDVSISGPYVTYQSRWDTYNDAVMDQYKATVTVNGTTYESGWTVGQMTNAWNYGYDAGYAAGKRDYEGSGANNVYVSSVWIYDVYTNNSGEPRGVRIGVSLSNGGGTTTGWLDIF